jgi:hypothetical protein
MTGIDNTTCQGCGMLVEPASAFHPGLYCELFKLGVRNPARWLASQHFVPDPAYWGEDAPARQARVAGR